MIQANELRIGNYLLFKGEFHKIDADIICDFQYHEPEIIEKLEQIKPIKLTDKIVEKCGFEVDTGRWMLKLKEFMIDLYPTGAVALINHNPHFMMIGPNIKIKSLHQLQNFYYALTGKELIYKS